MQEQVTIAIPVFNRDAYLRQALESALGQTAPGRVLVVDNASERGDFAGILKSYADPRLTYHRNASNLGPVGNWNRCLELCTTPYLLILHDDDVLELDLVERFLRLHEPGRTLYWGPCSLIDAHGRVTCQDPVANLDAFDHPRAWCLMNPAPVGIIFDCARARALGGFQPQLKMSPDWDLWFRLFLAGPSLRLPGRVGWYREYDDPLRGSTQLRAAPQSWFYWRNQIKRNFAYVHDRAGYREALRRRQLPGVSVRFLLQAAPQLTPRRFAYYYRICLLSVPETPMGYVSRWVIGLLGLRGFRFVLGLRRRSRGG
jgi:glycosyltransferase involved in cell wall biosynthesis